MTESIKAKLLTIAQDVLNELDREDVDVLQWDTSKSLYDYLASSMLIVEVVVEIEDTFDVRFPSDSLANIGEVTIDKIAHFIEQKTAAI